MSENPHNGDRPEVERIAPSALPVWILDGTQDAEAQTAIREARLEGLRRYVDGERGEQ